MKAPLQTASVLLAILLAGWDMQPLADQAQGGVPALVSHRVLSLKTSTQQKPSWDAEVRGHSSAVPYTAFCADPLHSLAAHGVHTPGHSASTPVNASSRVVLLRILLI